MQMDWMSPSAFPQIGTLKNNLNYVIIIQHLHLGPKVCYCNIIWKIVGCEVKIIKGFVWKICSVNTTNISAYMKGFNLIKYQNVLS